MPVLSLLRHFSDTYSFCRILAVAPHSSHWMIKLPVLLILLLEIMMGLGRSGDTDLS